MALNPPLEFDTPLARAKTATADELNAFLHEATEEVLLATLENPNLTESHVILLLRNRFGPFGKRNDSAVAGQVEVGLQAKGVRAAPCATPSARRSILRLGRWVSFYLFDLVKLALLPSAAGGYTPAKAEDSIFLTRVPHLPVGEKLTLARRGPARVAGALLARGAIPRL